MSIDLTHEPAIRLADVPKLPWLPRRRRGQRLHIATVFRWCKEGIRGHRLEYVQFGGCKVTSEAALQRFFASLSSQDAAVADPPASKRKKDRIAEELDAAGL